MTEQFWTYITASVSVGFGWLLNELGQLTKIRRENKRIKRKVLFYLLETFNSLEKLDTNKDIESLTEIIFNSLPADLQTPDDRYQINEYYSSTIPNIAQEFVSNNLKELEDNYIKTIDELSLIDPLAAYRLKGKNKIIDNFDKIKESIKYLSNSEVEIDSQSKQIENLLKVLKSDMFRSAIDDIIEEIYYVAKSINWITYFRTKKLINNHLKNNNSNEDLKSMINRYIENLDINY